MENKNNNKNKNKNKNKNASNSLVFGRWPQTKSDDGLTFAFIADTRWRHTINSDFKGIPG